MVRVMVIKKSMSTLSVEPFSLHPVLDPKLPVLNTSPTREIKWDQCFPRARKALRQLLRNTFRRDACVGFILKKKLADRVPLSSGYAYKIKSHLAR